MGVKKMIFLISIFFIVLIGILLNIDFIAIFIKEHLSTNMRYSLECLSSFHSLNSCF